MSYDRFDYTQIPEHMMAALDRYIRRGIQPGDFLSAVITNDLKRACQHADDYNICIIPTYVAYLYNECPAGSWGSEKALEYWIEQRREAAQDNLINSLTKPR